MSDELKNLIASAKAEAVRQNWQKIFTNKKVIYSGFILASFLVVWIIFGIAQNIRESKFSEILHQSLIDQELGNVDAAKKSLKKIYESKTAPSGVWSLAAMRYAAFLIEEGKNSEAIKIYLSVNGCFSCDDYISDLSGLLAVKMLLNDANELKRPDLITRIKKIENSASVLRSYIAEQRAFLELQNGNLKESFEVFESIYKSDKSSENIKNRAQSGMNIVISKGFEPKADPKK